ncbi:MAG: HlyC/CorC family transporter [Oscillospiraceae bacterium]|nr:HlyC/CorC family transporter [Oscillospiraceae bacterium]
MTNYLYMAGIILCVFFSNYFSSSEMAYSSCNRMRLESARDDGSKRAAAAVKITEHFDDTLSAILMGNNLVNIAASSLGSLLMIGLLGEAKGTEYAWVATVVITLLVIIFGETMPKIIAKNSANRLAISHAYFIRALTIVFKPLIWVVVGLVRLITMGMKGEKEDEDAAVEELSSIIETAEDEEVLDGDRSELVQAAIDFSDVSAYEVMTARVDMEALDIDDDWEDILRFVDDCSFSRIPVYEDSVDNIIGVLYLNHLLKALTGEEKPELRSLLMQPCYVYKTMKLPAVLSELKRAKQHLAIVTDEYAGTLGVLSMEDVLEQLVGEIWDETDEVEEEVVERPDGLFELDGDMTISDFLELLELDEESFEAESETVGGWTIERFGRFPRANDSFDFESLSVTVMVMDGRRVQKILVKKNEPLPGEE